MKWRKHPGTLTHCQPKNEPLKAGSSNSGIPELKNRTEKGHGAAVFRKHGPPIRQGHFFLDVFHPMFSSLLGSAAFSTRAVSIDFCLRRTLNQRFYQATEALETKTDRYGRICRPDLPKINFWWDIRGELHFWRTKFNEEFDYVVVVIKPSVRELNNSITGFFNLAFIECHHLIMILLVYV